MAAAPNYQSETHNISLILDRMTEVAVLPHVVYKVLDLTGSDETSAHVMEAAIMVDPGFSTRVLALANSAHMALPKKVSSIREAIMYCGVKSVRELAMTVGMYDLFVGKSDKESVRRRNWWRHSVDTAVTAKWIAETTKILAPDEAYTCGLLHMIGKTLLCRFGGEDYEQVENLQVAGYSDIEAEFEVYGCNHIDLALGAADKWGFPIALTAGMNYIALPQPDEGFHAHRAAVSLGHQIASYVIDSSDGSDPSRHLKVPGWALKILGIQPENIQQVVKGAVQAVGTAHNLHG